MNKTAIKNFAVWARNKLIGDIQYQLRLLGIDAQRIQAKLPQSTKDTEFYDIGTRTPYEVAGEAVKQRRALVHRLEQDAAEENQAAAYANIVEEVAYTWFNRLIAIRFMEVNDYLPGRLRVLSSGSVNKIEPELVSTPFEGDLSFTAAEQEQISQWQEENQIDALFRMLFIKECNALNDDLPELFEKTQDYTELLLNVSVTDPDGVVYHLVHDIDEADFNVAQGGQVEIIGWLYQYYNTEPKAIVDAYVKKGEKVTKEDLPAKTQLFTPDWIVRYMVENSLGRMWIEKKLSDGKRYDGNLTLDGSYTCSPAWTSGERQHYEKDFAAKMQWKYYLPAAEQEEPVEQQLAKIRAEYSQLQIENIKLLDPCMGSGHILVYAFDVFMQIYASLGYDEKEAAESILTHNLYGLDIDKRAFQLAYFALFMKARQYSRRILRKGIKLHICAIEESNSLRKWDEIAGNDLLAGQLDFEQQYIDLSNELIDIFHDAKEYGSILQIPPHDYAGLLDYLRQKQAEGSENLLFAGWLQESYAGMEKLVQQVQILAQRYEVVVTNPPYMGSSGMSAKLSKFVKENYPDSKSDLFAVFIERCLGLTRENGYQAMITQHAWMFLSSYENLRVKLQQKKIVNMAHLGARAFEEIGGEVVQTTSFVLQNMACTGFKGTFARLVEPTTQQGKEAMFLRGGNQFVVQQESFAKIPGLPIAYWASNQLLILFSKEKRIRDYAEPRHGMSTGNNDLCLRLWYEVINKKIFFSAANINEFDLSQCKYAPYKKGGAFRLWYGNNDYVIAYDKVSRKSMEKLSGYRSSSAGFFFRPSINWSDVSSTYFGVRMSPKGFAFDGRGASMFVDENNCLYLMGALTSKITIYILNILNPTLTFNIENVAMIPVIISLKHRDTIIELVEKNIFLSKQDWDSFETSWDFVQHPLLENRTQRLGLSSSYKQWKLLCNQRFAALKSNEEELNRIFIDIYGLADELTPEVADKDVTVARIYDTREEIPASMKGNAYVLTKTDVVKSLLSYAVGCMFGRYSLDKPGLVFAGGDFDKVYWKYKGQAALDEQNQPIRGGYAGISMAKYHYSRLHDSNNWANATVLAFEPDADNIIPILDESYSDDDMADLFVVWLKKVYGADTLEENLAFIAEALGKKANETSRACIRQYFLKDFYKDHVQTYKKRPIYWLYDSGKRNGFKALIYMHRYDADTTGRVRVDYLHRIERTYEAEIERMTNDITHGDDAREIARATKRRDKLVKQLKECQEYDEQISQPALARIPIDLDDGVKVNYEKVQTVHGKTYVMLAKI